MRVIGGKLKRRTLKEVPSDITRSTKDRVKESVFNMIMPSLYDANVLDLFAGSGALGIEAISRGAAYCDFIEKDTVAHTVLQSNIDALDIRPQVNLKRMDALSFINQIKTSYNIILLDPPYKSGLLDDILSIISKNYSLTKEGIIVILSGKSSSYNIPSSFKETKVKTIGITDVKILSWSESL